MKRVEIEILQEIFSKYHIYLQRIQPLRKLVQGKEILQLLPSTKIKRSSIFSEKALKINLNSNTLYI